MKFTLPVLIFSLTFAATALSGFPASALTTLSTRNASEGLHQNISEHDAVPAAHGSGGGAHGDSGEGDGSVTSSGSHAGEGGNEGSSLRDSNALLGLLVLFSGAVMLWGEL
jgi:hypothetical protein